MMLAHRSVSVLPLVLALILVPVAGHAAAGLSFTCADQGVVTDLGRLVVFHTLVRNTGTAADTCTLNIVKSVPPGWITSLCEGATCYNEHVVEITFTLAPGEETNVDLDVQVETVAGCGSVTMTVTSGVDPGWSAALDFHVGTSGLDLLLVTGDEGTTGYYEAALAGSGLSHATWPRQVAGSLANAEISLFPRVVWFAGEGSPGLDDTDRAVLAYYLQHGGALFLSGRDLAYEACDPASPFHGAMAASWFSIVLGSGYVGDGAPYQSAVGPAGDPVTGGLACGLQGGDGSGSNTDCDRLTAEAGGTVSLTYEDGTPAAVRSTYGLGRSFFCAFDLAGVSTAAERAALLQAFLDWVGGPSPAPEGIPDAGRARVAAFPNPFNPRTTLRLDAGADQAIPVAVDIHDVRGRLVRKLFRGLLPPGGRSLVWEGVDDSGRPAPAGLYFVVMTAPDGPAAGKIVLAR
ncbi:MAG: FlgD immunoglobulin-like domain containing protein [Candidatus Krumholzibacteriia bacterium]